MKLNKLLTCVAAALIASASAMADRAPFKVSTYEDSVKDFLGKWHDIRFIKITALDDAAVWKIKLNRGNCEVDPDYILYGSKSAGAYIDKLQQGQIVEVGNNKYRLVGTMLQKYTSQGWKDVGDYKKKFGQVSPFETTCAEILEVELTTDDNTWTFSFD